MNVKQMEIRSLGAVVSGHAETRIAGLIGSNGFNWRELSISGSVRLALEDASQLVSTFILRR